MKPLFSMIRLLALVAAVWSAAVSVPAAAPLVSLEYKIVGTELRVTPAVLSVPKGIAGSIAVELTGSSTTNGSVSITNAYVEATLRGPGMDARRLIAAVNTPLLLPALNLVGDYQLDGIRLVDATTGETKLEGNPSAVPVRVFDEVLISRVTSRPLTADEIKEKGIAIDENNFRAVEFEVGFVLDGKRIPVKFPVVAPRFDGNTEIIPAAELEKRLVTATLINQEIAASTELPAELSQSQLNIQVQGINFQRVEVGEESLALTIPPIPALMVIPGNIGYLNQFFSVQIFTENGAPAGSGLSVHNVKAQLILPPGADRVGSTNYFQPGDDPLRFARIGADKEIQPVQTIVRAGPDGQFGTADDIARLQAGESGQAEFFVEGLQEGLHIMDLDLTADLDGLAAGTVRVKGKAAGSVLVRNPKFSIAFTHPRTVRFGEPYDASVTILNTGITPANFVRVTLPGRSISGGVLESPEMVELGTILPGQTATARYRIRAQRTGAISFSNLTTGEDSVQGRFRLSMGIDERGVALSPDTLVMPDFANALPTNILYAAERVLGQALSASTGAQLPPGVVKPAKSIITTRVLDLAEAGQRLKYGDSLRRVVIDLMLDWQGGRSYDAGFDQILRETNAGLEWREAVARVLDEADALDGPARIAAIGADLAGRSEAWILAAASSTSLVAEVRGPAGVVALEKSALRQSVVYPGPRTTVLVFKPAENLVVNWQATNDLAATSFTVLSLGTNGVGRRLDWSLASISGGSCIQHAVGSAGDLLTLDAGCDGSLEQSVAGTPSDVVELPPALVSVRQDWEVVVGRPQKRCLVPQFGNYGTVVAVLFSKPMTQATVNQPSAYRLDNGNTAGSVQIQPGGRVVLLNMRQTLGAIRPRKLTATGIADVRGNPVAVAAVPVISDLTQGIAIRGRVLRADGSPAANVPVTLTMYDQQMGTDECFPFIQRPLQVFTGDDGGFDIDFVLGGIPYSVSATDTGGLTQEAINLILSSVEGDRVARDRLQQIAENPATQNSLLAAFAAGSMPELIAKAEGLDRALFRDVVDGVRFNTESVIALRFRGRGTVEGRVLAADGTTPVNLAAVNLTPDPGSRELVRGMLTGSDGRFRFNGVPLGIFSISATNSFGNFRVLSQSLLEPGQTSRVDIVLSTNRVLFGGLAGRVVETDGVTPHAGARVYVGKISDGKVKDIVGSAEADSDGLWSIASLPVGSFDVAAIAIDGARQASRTGVQVQEAGVNFLTLTLNGRATVFGRVETSTGRPVTNAIVAGGTTLVRTDANGLFTMPGVPLGRKSLSAGVERDPAAGWDFPRVGSASLDVLPGVDNFVVIRFNPAATISGRVLDENGVPVPNARVAIPQEEGFLWVNADASGNYVFEGLGLDSYELSAPGPPVAQTDTSGLVDQIRGGSEADVVNAFTKAAAIFTGAADPFLNGEASAFNPATFGFTRTSLTFDGQMVVADIRFLRVGSVSGTVVNGQGVPIGAKVRLTGLGLLANGKPAMRIKGDQNSDPALGTFFFKNALPVGSWGLQAASPFFPVVISDSGVTTSTERNVTNVVLQFPRTREINGRLVGTVFNPDGSTAGSNVNVQISFSADYIIRTDGNGFFDTQIGLPATGLGGEPGRGYTITVTNLDNGLVGQASTFIYPGVTNRTEVRLLDTGSLKVVARFANGALATNAAVEIQRGGFPHQKFNGVTDASGVARFGNLFEGGFSVSGSFATGPTTISGRSGVTVVRGVETEVVVVLQPTASIAGRFVRGSDNAAIESANVNIGFGVNSPLAFASTGPSGEFSVSGLPLGTYVVVAENPVNGLRRSQNVTLATDGETVPVLLVEPSLATVSGLVIGSYGTNVVPGALVEISFSNGLNPGRSVTAGPDGVYSFAGVPSGGFSIRATDPLSTLTGSVSGNIPDGTAAIAADIRIRSLGSILVRVLRPDGVAPGTNTTVTLSGGGGLTINRDTDTNGTALFVDLPLGPYNFIGRSRILAESLSAGGTNASLSLPGAVVEVPLRLLGVGSVTGRVFRSDGATPATGVEVDLAVVGGLNPGVTDVAFTDGTGAFRFDNVPVGGYRVIAFAEALAGRAEGDIAVDGATNGHTLVLGSSGVILGKLVRANGSNAVPNADVLIQFTPQSGLPGRATARTTAEGLFRFDNVPAGSFSLETIVPSVAGLARLSSAITTNGQTNDLGVVVLDEDDPRILGMSPTSGSEGVPVNAFVDLFFNEAIDASSVSNNGVFLKLGTNTVPASVVVRANPTNGVLGVVRLTPVSPLLSLRTYEVTVVDNERVNAVGVVVARGPVDRVGRPLLAPFVGTFTTLDADPPVLLSVFPTNGQVQVDPRSVPRLSFNEPVRPTNFFITLTGPGGIVPGSSNLLLNSQALAFTPTTDLQPNATYTLTVSGVRDLAGNALANQPLIVQFSTLDTIGPVLGTLRIANSTSPIAGTTVQVEALLAVSEPDVAVRFTQDFLTIGSTTNLPFRVAVQLPAGGSTTIRAIATDRFNNDGPFAELVINTVTNQPPVASLARVNPASGPVGNGQIFTLSVGATDDSRVTNLNVVGIGGISLFTNFPNGDARTLAFVVPPSAAPGGLFEFRVQATDELGLRSAEKAVSFEIVDRAAPGLAVLTPTNGSRLPAAAAFPLTVVSSDNSTNALTLVVIAGSPVNVTQTVVVASSTANGPVTNVFSIPLTNAPASGGTLAISVRATDTATNTTTLNLAYQMADTVAPQLASASPTNGAVRVNLWLTGTLLTFGEALDVATITTNTVRFTNDAGLTLPYQVVVQDASSFRVSPLTLPIPPGVTFTNELLAGVKDVAGNSLAGTTPTNGLPVVFRTAAVLDVFPTNGTPVIPGQKLTASVNFETGLGADAVRFVFGTNAPADVAVHNNTTNASFELRLATNFNGTTVAASFRRSGQNPYGLPPVSLNLLSRTADADGDGLPNGWEADNDLEPFRANAGEDPDADGLTNLQELDKGTRPLVADTDGDGTLDGADPLPLLRNNRPIAGVSQGSGSALSFDGVNDWISLPEKAASDLSRSPQWTIEAWIKPAAVNHMAWPTIYSEGEWIISSGLRTGSAKPDGWINNSANLIGNPVVPLNQWSHLAMTSDGTTWRFYLNGVDAGSQSAPGVAANNNGAAIGSVTGPVSSSFFSGVIDEVRVWKRAISQSELVGRMTNALAGDESGLAGYWPFDEGQGTIANDASLGGTPGSLGNGVPAASPTWVASDSPVASVGLSVITNDARVSLRLTGSDPDNDVLAFRVVDLPRFGRLFASTDGLVAGDEITNAPFTLAGTNGFLVYQGTNGFVGADVFRFVANDGLLDSLPATYRLNIRSATNQFRAPTINPVGSSSLVEIVQFGTTNIGVSASDLDGNLRGFLSVDESDVTGTFVQRGLTARFINIGFTPGDVGQVNFDTAAVLVTNVPNINYPSTSSAPWPGSPVRADQVAARFDGKLFAPTNGAYTFILTSDDGAQIIVDGVVVVSRGNGSGEASGSATLSAGPHDIRVVHFNGGGPGNLVVSWSGPGFARQVIPPEAFRSPAALFTETGTTSLLQTNLVGQLGGTLRLLSFNVATGQISLVAVDFDGLSATQRFQVVVLGDLDRDGVSDRDDADIDGDGLSNAVELAQGTDPRSVDSDGDSIPDGLDPFALAVNQPPFPGDTTNIHAMSFDGGDHINFGNDPALRITGDQTVEFWINPANLNNRQNPFAKAYGGEGTMTLEPDGSMSYFFGRNGGNGEPYEGFSSGPIAANQWTHVALVRDLVAKRVKFYLNGQLSSDAATSFTNAVAGGNNLELGRGYVSQFAGRMAHFRLWNRALAAEEVRASLTNRLAGPLPGLVGYWPLNDSGLVATNLSSTNLLGSLGSGTASVAPTRTNGVFVQSLLVTSSVPKVLVTLAGGDPDGPATNAVVTQLPASGRLFRTANGLDLSSALTNAPAGLSNVLNQAFYVPRRGTSVVDSIRFDVSDGYLTRGDGYLFIQSVGDPLFDSDGDGMTDGYEIANGLDPNIDDTALDLDLDGLTNQQEFLAKTAANNRDTDGDGVEDAAEMSRGTSPLVADTDGDGLGDFLDPQPTNVLAGLTFTVPTSVSLFEGESSNVVVQVSSPDAGITLLDYVPTNLPPAFVTLGDLVFTNNSSNTVVTAIVRLNPLHDAAGSHVVKLRAVDNAGRSGVFEIPVTVNDTPSLTVTRWKNAVNGSWTDASKWTDGLPGSNTIAVIDLPGSYVVAMQAAARFGGLVLNHTNVQLRLDENVVFSAPAELRSGMIWLNNSERVLTVNRTLAIRDRLQIYSRDINQYLNGTGRVEVAGSAGSIGCFVWGGSFGGWGRIQAPTTVAGGGRLFTAANAWLAQEGANIALAGRLDLPASGRFGVLNTTPAVDLAILGGSQLTGGGALEVFGSNRARFVGDVVVDLPLTLQDSSSAVGRGVVLAGGPQTIRNSWEPDLLLLRGAAASFQASTLRGNVTVLPGASTDLQREFTVTILGQLVNRGTMSFRSRDANCYITGAGSLVNEGLVSVYVDGGSFGGFARFSLAVTNGSAGTWLVRSNAWNGFGASGRLVSFGRIEVQGGGRLVGLNESPRPEFVLRPGSLVAGNGSFELTGSSLLVMDTTTTIEPPLSLSDSASIGGAGTLQFAGAHTLRNTFRAPVEFLPGTSIAIDNLTLVSNALIHPGANVFLNRERSLTISGTLTNRGLLQLRSRDANSFVSGGLIVNEGEIRTFVDGGSFGGFGQVRSGIINQPGALFSVETNAWAGFYGGGWLANRGRVNVRGGDARLVFVNEVPTPLLTNLFGGEIVGAGRAEFHGTSRLHLDGEVTFLPSLQLRDSASVSGNATLRLAGANQILNNSLSAPVVVESNAFVRVDGTTFNGPLLIDQGGQVHVLRERSLVVNSTLTNSGVLSMGSRDGNTFLGGLGRVYVGGSFEAVVDGGSFGAFAHVSLPVEILPAGRLLVRTNAWMQFRAGGGLKSSGLVEVQTSGRLLFPDEFPPTTVELADGSRLIGDGETVFSSRGLLNVSGDASIERGLFRMEGPSQIGGGGVLAIRTNATLRFDHSANIEASVTVEGTFAQTSSSVENRIEGTLTIQPGGVLTVPGRLTAASVVNKAGSLPVTVVPDGSLVTTRWTNSVSGNWSAAANWSAGVPNAGRIAVVDVPGTYTITVDAAASAARLLIGADAGTQTVRIVSQALTLASPSRVGTNGVLELAGSSLGGNGDIEVEGAFNWSGGTLSGGGTMLVRSTGRLALSGANKTLARSLRLAGQGAWSAGNMSANGAVFTVETNGVFQISADVSFFDGVLDVLGTARKVAGSGAWSVQNQFASNTRLNNAGTVEVDSGQLVVAGGGSSSGVFDLGTDTVLRFIGGTHTLSGAGRINGDGALQVTAGSVSVFGAVQASVAVAVSGGGLGFENATQEIGSVVVSGGSLGGAATTTVTNSMSWLAGTLSGGPLNIAPGAVMTVSSSSGHDGRRTINNSGTVIWAADSGFIRHTDNVWNNLAGAVWEWRNDAEWYDGVINNSGTITKTGGTGTKTLGNSFNSNMRFNQGGFFEIRSGTVRLDNSGTWTGPTVVASNSILHFANGSQVQSGAGTVDGPGLLRLSSGSYSIETPANINRLEVTGGTFGGTAEVTVTNSLSWVGGTLSGGPLNIASNAAMTISSGNGHDGRRTINNFGVATWTADSQWIRHTDSVWNNRPGSTWIWQNDSEWWDGVINNEGTIVKTAGTGTKVLGNFFNSNMRFNQDGVFELQSGTLRLENSGTWNGPVLVGTNAVLQFQTGTHPMGSSSPLTGLGRLRVTGATVTMAGSYELAGPLSVESGSLAFNQPAMSLGTVSVSGGTLGGSAEVTVTNSLSWVGGTLSGGPLNIATGAAMTVSSGNGHDGRRTINNFGLATWTADSAWIRHTDSVWNNKPGSTWIWQNDSEWWDGVINNEGTIVKTAGTGTKVLGNFFNSNMRLNQDGVFELQSGTVRLDNSGTWNGPTLVGTNAVLQLQAGTHPLSSGGVLTGLGRLRVTGATVTMAGSYELAGPLSVESGSLAFNQPAQFLGTASVSGGTLGGSAEVTVTNSLSWVGGTLSGGPLNIASNAAMTISSGNGHDGRRTINNFGVATWTADSQWIRHTDSVWNNRPGSTWIWQNDSEWWDGVINNEGTIVKTAGTGTKVLGNFFNSNMRFNQDGVFEQRSGTVRLDQGSVFCGTNFIATNAVVHLNAGTHTLSTNVVFGGTGTLNMGAPIVLEGAVDFGTVFAIFNGNSSVSGVASVANSSGGVVRIDRNLAFSGPFAIGGELRVNAAAVTLTINSTLTLLPPDGLLTNPGTVRVVAFVDNGRPVVGNAPVIIPPPAPASIRIGSIAVVPASGPAPASVGAAGMDVVVSWSAPSGSAYELQVSADLVQWTTIGSAAHEVSPGQWKAAVSVDQSSVKFFRVRQKP